MIFSIDKLTTFKKILFLSFLLGTSIYLYTINNEIVFDYKEKQISHSQSTIAITPPDNIIIFLIDGFGFEHLSLAEVLQSNEQNNVKNFKSGWHSNQTEHSYLTDSGASATALSTGYRTVNKAIGVNTNGERLKNLIEMAIESGLKTGVVTDSYFWDATPAAFTAHVSNRNLSKDIIQQQAISNIDLLIGEISDESPYSASELGHIFANNFVMSSFGDKTNAKPTAILLPDEHFISQNDPSYFSKVAQYSIDFFEENYSERFLLILETEEVDTSSHNNDSTRLISAINSINQTLTVLKNYIIEHPNSLVIVTSDHETGALSLVKSEDSIKIKWSSTGHSRSLVPILTMGKSAEKLAIPTTNDQLGQLMQKLI